MSLWGQFPSWKTYVADAYSNDEGLTPWQYELLIRDAEECEAYDAQLREEVLRSLSPDESKSPSYRATPERHVQPVALVRQLLPVRFLGLSQN
jgi:hypothetical protein